MVSAGLFVLRFGVPAGDWLSLVAGCLGGVQLAVPQCCVGYQQKPFYLDGGEHRFSLCFLVRFLGTCSAVLLVLYKGYHILREQRVLVRPLGAPNWKKANVHLYHRCCVFLISLDPVVALAYVVVA